MCTVTTHCFICPVVVATITRTASPQMACTLPQLFKAISADDIQAVKRVLSFNPSLAHGKHPKDGYTPLHAAAAIGSLALVRELLQAGVSCQAVDANFEVPLHVACQQVGQIITSGTQWWSHRSREVK